MGSFSPSWEFKGGDNQICYFKLIVQLASRPCQGLELAYLKLMICTLNAVLKLNESAENLGRMILRGGGSKKERRDLSPDHLSLDSRLASDPDLRPTCPKCQPYTSASVRPHLFLTVTHYVFMPSYNVLVNLVFAFMLTFVAHSEEQHSEGVVLKVEADARPIKNPEVGKKKSLYSASRNQTRSVTPSSTSSLRTPKTASLMSRSRQDRRLETISSQPFHQTRSGTQPSTSSLRTPKTASLMSRSRQDWRLETISSQSFHHFNGAPRKRTSVKSRSPRIYQILETQSVRRFSFVTLGVTQSSTQSATKVSHGAQLYPSPPHLASRLEKSVVDWRNKSTPFSKTSIKMESSVKGYARRLGSKHSTDVQMTSILRLKPSPTVSYWSERNVISKMIRNRTSHSEKAAALLDGSSLCRESPIFHDVSPPNGTAVALGPVSDMRSCIHLSCDVSGDVAYMRNSQCFVITCDRPERCDLGKPDTDGIGSTKTQVAILRKRNQLKKGKRTIKDVFHWLVELVSCSVE